MLISIKAYKLHIWNHFLTHLTQLCAAHFPLNFVVFCYFCSDLLSFYLDLFWISVCNVVMCFTSDGYLWTGTEENTEVNNRLYPDCSAPTRHISTWVVSYSLRKRGCVVIGCTLAKKVFGKHNFEEQTCLVVRIIVGLITNPGQTIKNTNVFCIWFYLKCNNKKAVIQRLALNFRLTIDWGARQ